MKKIFFIMSLLLMLIFNVNVSAASAVSDKTADKGENITLDVKMTETKKIKSGAISFEYDKNYFELVSGEWTVTNAMLTNFDMSKELGAFAYMNLTNVSGNIFKVTFKIKNSTPYDSYVIKIKLQYEEESQKVTETITSNIKVECNHSYTLKEESNETLVNEASCTQAAKYYYKCSKCKKIGTQTFTVGTALGHTGGTATCSKKAVCTRCNKQYGSLLNHTYGNWNTVKEATEDEEGLKERSCSKCGYVNQEVIGKLDHIHVYTSKIEDPTCVDQGYTVYTCKCGDSYKDNYITSLGHDYSDWTIIKQPTETETGLKEKNCTRCNDKVEEVIPKTDHVHTYTSKITNPTCVNKGYTTHTCKCGDSYKDNYKDALGHTEEVITGYDSTCAKTGLTNGKKCIVCNKITVEQKEIAIKQHSFSEWKIVVEATEDKEGLKEKTCSECGFKETEVIPTLNHTHKYEEKIEFDSTCFGKGLKSFKCKCGDSYNEIIEQKQHNYKEFVILIEPTEKTTGLKQKECMLCGYKVLEEIEKLSHTHNYNGDFIIDNEGHYKQCECNEQTAKETHTYNDPIKKDGLYEYECSICGHIKVEAIHKESKTGGYVAIMISEAVAILALGVLFFVFKKKRF